MFFDLSDLNPEPDRRERIQMRLCTGCRCVLPQYHTACPTCEDTTLLPFLDRRPLLLDRDTRNGILTLIDEGVSQLTDEVLSDEQSYLSNEYLPFLSRLLKESEVAEKYESMGNHQAYRRTDWTQEEIIDNLRDMVLPTTAVQ